MDKTMKNKIYAPILKKINCWLDYAENKPKVDYKEAPEVHDKYRATHDLDCILTGGNLNADTIISLWTPLKVTIYAVGNVEPLGLKAGETIYKTPEMLKKIRDNIEIVLPAEMKNKEVLLLSKLFEIGQERCNVMILPEREMNGKRGCIPYNDYMPYFLNECFSGGEFASYFAGDADFEGWAKRECLHPFFENGEITREKIKDLAGTGNIQSSLPDDISLYLSNYIEVLKLRCELMND